MKTNVRDYSPGSKRGWAQNPKASELHSTVPQAQVLPRPAETGARSHPFLLAIQNGSAPEPACPLSLHRASASSCNQRGGNTQNVLEDIQPEVCSRHYLALANVHIAGDSTPPTVFNSVITNSSKRG